MKKYFFKGIENIFSTACSYLTPPVGGTRHIHTHTCDPFIARSRKTISYHREQVVDHLFLGSGSQSGGRVPLGDTEHAVLFLV